MTVFSEWILLDGKSWRFMEIAIEENGIHELHIDGDRIKLGSDPVPELLGGVE